MADFYEAHDLQKVTSSIVFWVATLFMLLVLYVLSFGPIFALYTRYEGARRLMRGPFDVVYYPLLSVASWIDETTWGEPLDQCFDDYIDWWRR